MPARFNEDTVEQAVLAWLESLGYAVESGADIVPGEPEVERHTYKQAPLLYKKITTNLQQSRTLATIHDALLPKLITDELHIFRAMVQRELGT